MAFIFQVKTFSIASDMQKQLARMDSIANAQPPQEYIDAVSDRKKYPAMDERRLSGLIFSKENLAKARIFISGERHTTEWQRGYFAASMQRLKELGFTTVGLEFVCSSDQGLLDGKKYRQLSEIFKSHWEWDAPLTRESIMGLIKQAHGHGLRVIALDLPPERQGREMAASDAGIEAKDAYMSSQVLDGAGNGRMLVLCGAAHNKGVAERLSAQGVAPLSVIFVGGDSLKPAPIPAGAQPGVVAAGLFEKAGRLAGRSQELFAIPKSSGLPGANENYYPDYIIHMPETEPMPAFMKPVSPWRTPEEK